MKNPAEDFAQFDIEQYKKTLRQQIFRDVDLLIGTKRQIMTWNIFSPHTLQIIHIQKFRNKEERIDEYPTEDLEVPFPLYHFSDSIHIGTVDVFGHHPQARIGGINATRYGRLPNYILAPDNQFYSISNYYLILEDGGIIKRDFILEDPDIMAELDDLEIDIDSLIKSGEVKKVEFLPESGRVYTKDIVPGEHESSTVPTFPEDYEKILELMKQIKQRGDMEIIIS